MMINEIIVNYLSSNKRLVVPNFGAFLKKENGTITFVELLKKDDGILTSLISKDMEIDHDSAVSIIDAFVDSIKESVKRDGAYQIVGIGSLIVNVNGIYNLIFNGVKASVSEKTVVNADVVKEAIDAPVLEPTPVSVPTPAQVSIPVPTPVEPQYVTPEEVKVETPKPLEVKAVVEAPAYDHDTEVAKVTYPVSKMGAKSVQQTQHQHTVESPVRRDVDRGSNSGDKIARERYALQKRGTKKQMDFVMILAIIAAILALVILAYGALINTEIPPFNL